MILHSLVGSNHDNTIGTTRTIDSCCRSILKDVHSLNIVRINIADCSCKWNTIKNNKWVVAGCQRTRTTYTNLHWSTWLRRSLHHLYTSNTSLKSICYITSRNLTKHIALYWSYGTSYSLLTLSTITNYNNIIKNTTFFFKIYANKRLIANDNFLSNIAYIRNHKGWAWSNIQVEVTINIGNNTIWCALHHYGSTNKWTLWIAYTTSNFLWLLNGWRNTLSVCSLSLWSVHKP